MTQVQLDHELKVIRNSVNKREKIVLVYGNFLVVHPGHLRLLKFAKQYGDRLVVAVIAGSTKDRFPPVEERVDTVRSVDIVDDVIALHEPIETLILGLEPHIVVKGKEFEFIDNPEQKLIEGLGGKLVFSSGESTYSKLGMWSGKSEDIPENYLYPQDYLGRHQINPDVLKNTIDEFKTKNVLVIGDLIVDEYVECEPLGMSREDPTIVVSPIKQNYFLGGAGIVAAHARGLGANVTYFSVSGKDFAADYAKKLLADYGVEAKLAYDSSRPTTLKQRYRAAGKALLRVSYLRQHEIDHAIQKKMLKNFRIALQSADLVIFSDFNYGCLPQSLVNLMISDCQKAGIKMVADSQTSSQIGDISRFKHMELVTPTEIEARISLKDERSGLAVLADKLIQASDAQSVYITLGGEGLLIYAYSQLTNKYIADQLPALNQFPMDVSGAGDSLMITSSLALISGANIWEAAYLGSLAAAMQVSSIGNTPLSNAKLIDVLTRQS
ncbi:MAG: PfkB family carbohydrate kinase [Betaproteobacteria bacterium]